MGKTIRCKYMCHAVRKAKNPYQGGDEAKTPFLYSAEFSPVCGGSKENEQFYKWTPSGKLEVGVYKEDAFEPGKEYYIDITLAEAAEQK
jgi:hypothetical protein